ncbi:MAG TPA: phosphatase PAP2 family protein [Methanocorpusculum sp.]|nr:phosphatase PAP2 family protein [Methanocorpusculum sp.]
MIFDGGTGFLLAIADMRDTLPSEVTDLVFQFSDNDQVKLMLPLLICLFAVWCLDKKYTTFIGLNLLNTVSLVSMLKIIFAVPRPWVINPDVRAVEEAVPGAYDPSFPSGHTAAAAMAWGSLAVILRRHKIVVILCCIIIGLAGFSRLFLCVHTPLDVIGGIILALLALLINWKLACYLEAHPEKDITVALIDGGALSVLWLSGLILPTYVESTAGFVTVFPGNVSTVVSGLALTWGFFACWIVSRRFVQYTPPKKWSRRIIVFAAGAVSTALLLLPLKLLVLAGWTEKTAADSLLYLALIIYTILIYPLIVKLIAKKCQTKE